MKLCEIPGIKKYGHNIVDTKTVASTRVSRQVTSQAVFYEYTANVMIMTVSEESEEKIDHSSSLQCSGKSMNFS